MIKMQQVLWLTLMVISQVFSDNKRCEIGSNFMNHGSQSIVEYNDICYRQKCTNGIITAKQIGCAGFNACFQGNKYFITRDCVYSRCNSEVVSNTLTFTVEYMFKFCKDYYDKCRRQNEIFTKQMGEEVYEQCLCKVSDLSILYFKCYGNPSTKLKARQY